MMKELQGLLAQESGKAFNKKVANAFGKYSKFIVKLNIKKFGTFKLVDSEGNDLGDIDVLAVDTVNHILYVVESKDLLLARTPAELENEIVKIFGKAGMRRSIIERHQRRVDWIRDNLINVSNYLNLNYDSSWKIEPLIVTDQELLTPYLLVSPIRVRSIAQLEKELQERYNN